jgi:uncharacterized protein (TIGR03067 family)
VNALLFGTALVIGAPALKDPPKTEPPFVGDWTLVEWLQQGTRMAFADGTGVEFRPDGKRLWRDGPGSVDERGYRLLPKTSPAQIDLLRNDGGPQPTVFPSIYKIDGDRLILAIGSPGGDRPTEFDPAKVTYLMTFTRIKSKD